MAADDLAQRIRASTESSVVDETLRTSERVLARITDGIYRQPGSALRELISNAYDADASRVVIQTDRPRFKQISIEDDGAGMTPEVLAHMLQSIGGSTKRRYEGAELGVTNENDPLLSPKGRRLIGRIGIGLFSVSQLTQSFQITTKVAGDDHRTIATIIMRQHSAAGPGTEDDDDYEAGRVKIWREPASDPDSHGTTISLVAIRPHTRRTLQNDAIWKAVEAAAPDDPDPPVPPRFNIGRVIDGTSDELRERAHSVFDDVPWSKDDEPREAFSQLVDAVWDSLWDAKANPKLSTLFDEYLRMVWQLALSVPLPYVDGHPFEIPFERSEVAAYEIGSGTKGRLSAIKLGNGRTLADACGLKAQLLNRDAPFRVLVDDLELTRPLRFRNLPKTSHQLKRSMLIIGRTRETFDGVDTALTGGPLAFEAYLLWNPKIAPTEHQGSLIRIHGASGTLFDASFMRFQVAEQTRRTQISCEIFVSEGLEGALNIDRESFNFAHPHVVFLTIWLHNALRRLTNEQKTLASIVRREGRQAKQDEQENRLQEITADAWTTATGDEDALPTYVEIVYPGEEPSNPEDDDRDRMILDADLVRLERSASAQRRMTERQLAAIASILDAFGVSEVLSEDEFDALLAALSQVLQVDE